MEILLFRVAMIATTEGSSFEVVLFVLIIKSCSRMDDQWPREILLGLAILGTDEVSEDEKLVVSCARKVKKVISSLFCRSLYKRIRLIFLPLEGFGQVLNGERGSLCKGQVATIVTRKKWITISGWATVCIDRDIRSIITSYGIARNVLVDASSCYNLI